MNSFFLSTLKTFLQNLLFTASKQSTPFKSIIPLFNSCLKEIEAGDTDERNFEYFLSQIFVELGKPMIVWHMSNDTNMRGLSNKLPVINYLTSTRTFRDCLVEIVRLKDILLTPSFSIRFFSHAENIILEVKDKNFKSSIPNYRDDFAISFILYVLREYIGRDFDYVELKIPNARPNFLAEEIKHITKATISYHDGHMQAVISQKALSFKNNFFNQNNFDLWREMVDKLLASTQVSQNTTSKVIASLENCERPAAESLNSLAEKLAMSASTLRRNLLSENTTFGKLHNRFLDELSLSELLTSEIKIDALSLKLGYSERSTFERAFKNKFGKTPAQFRELANGVIAKQDGLTIEQIANSMPPLPKSCQQLISSFNKGTLNVESAVRIIEQDPMFIGRIMGLASRAIYGSPPKNLADAIGHKLGLDVVKNLAIVFATRDCLKDKIQGVDIDAHIQAFVIGPRIHQLLTKATSLSFENRIEAINQTLTIGPLGFLLMSHKKLIDHSTFTELVDNSEDLQSLFVATNQHLKYSIFGTSILLLSYWGIETAVIKNVSILEQHIVEGKSLNIEQQFLLFTFEVMFEFATRTSVTDKLKSRAENIFDITNMDSIFELLKEA